MLNDEKPHKSVLQRHRAMGFPVYKNVKFCANPDLIYPLNLLTPHGTLKIKIRINQHESPCASLTRNFSCETVASVSSCNKFFVAVLPQRDIEYSIDVKRGTM